MNFVLCLQFSPIGILSLSYQSRDPAWGEGLCGIVDRDRIRILGTSYNFKNIDHALIDHDCFLLIQEGTF